MKQENKIILFIIIIGLIIFNILSYKELKQYKEESLLSRNPFTEIKILNQKVELNKKNRLYKNHIDCSNIQENEPIISYKLVEGKETYKVSPNIKLINNTKILTSNYKDITNILTRLTVKDENNKYEQIFTIESTCQQGEISWENK